MSEIQQQLADGARPLARVGDVIEYDQDVPPNVVKLRDQDADIWTRQGNGFLCDAAEGARYGNTGYWPMTVVEVDPEPQPAEPRGVFVSLSPTTVVVSHRTGGPLGININGHAYGVPDGGEVAFDVPEPASPTAPGPLVLRLPEVPAGAVALIAKSDEGNDVRFVRTATGWHRGPNDVRGIWSLADILVTYGPVTVEFAPPREPRTWPKLDLEPDQPRRVEVEGHGRWSTVTAGSDGLYRHDDGVYTVRPLVALRHLGDVREVLDDGQ